MVLHKIIFPIHHHKNYMPVKQLTGRLGPETYFIINLFLLQVFQPLPFNLSKKQLKPENHQERVYFQRDGLF